eukprot:TRINITY_DN23551_c0_g1_i4.p1 TRINITY_DN23551_c0_g1~~TRINITY_DN23551_c0_g1_i4.p1  ORF type:complete len:294 (+),score=15.40 TRINITY_DN23551_c0_g1_i4:103-984(+)
MEFAACESLFRHSAEVNVGRTVPQQRSSTCTSTTMMPSHAGPRVLLLGLLAAVTLGLRDALAYIHQTTGRSSHNRSLRGLGHAACRRASAEHHDIGASVAFAPPTLSPLPDGAAWGRMTTEFALSDPSEDQGPVPELGQWLRGAVAEHRLMVLRGADRDIVPSACAEAHVALAQAISGGRGIEDRLSTESGSGHASLFRVSNDASRGATGVGLNGWHIDGTHKLRPQLFHSFHCSAATPPPGSTHVRRHFAPLHTAARGPSVLPTQACRNECADVVWRLAAFGRICPIGFRVF